MPRGPTRWTVTSFNDFRMLKSALNATFLTASKTVEHEHANPTSHNAWTDIYAPIPPATESARRGTFEAKC